MVAEKQTTCPYWGCYCRSTHCICFPGVYIWLELDGVQWWVQQNNDNENYSWGYHNYRATTHENTLGLATATCSTCYSCCSRIWSSMVHYKANPIPNSSQRSC